MRVVACVVLLLMGLVIGFSATGSTTPSQSNNVLLSWSLPTPEGEIFQTDTLVNQAVVLTFWASWCGPCKQELAALEGLVQQHPSLKVVAVNVDEDVLAAHGFLSRNPLGVPVVMDTSHTLMQKLDVSILPTTFWITRTGTIQKKTIGFNSEIHAAMGANAEAILSN